jgi:hypothetical protein
VRIPFSHEQAITMLQESDSVKLNGKQVTELLKNRQSAFDFPDPEKKEIKPQKMLVLYTNWEYEYLSSGAANAVKSSTPGARIGYFQEVE